MARIRTLNEIVLNFLDYYRTVQPLLDTKPGSSARDVLIDGLSTQLARCYEELGAISNLQSLRQAIGSDLDKYAANFGAVRKPGAKSTGPSLLTFPALVADFSIDKNSLVTSKNGTSFYILNSLTISTVFESSYKATAAKYRADLDFVGITDQYAVEMLVEATSPGIQGNIPKYSLISTTVPNITNVTNVSAIGGGKDAENDATFKSRIFAIFSGSNTGTSLGYKTAVLSDPSVIDAVVIEPGDSLMTRDGTQVSIAADGTRTIVSEGTGGKVDIYAYGTRLQESSDSFVYRDLSNTGEPTNSDNDYVLGQIAADAGKTITKKRLDDLAGGVLPNQPINSVISVSGSLSGANFKAMSTDNNGIVTGNYELIKDTGSYAGSPWGFDKIHWISNTISDLAEDKTKQTFNSQDPLAFTDVLEIGKIDQNISVTNENSTVSSTDRSSIQLRHSPCGNVTRVFNVTTGERYVVYAQNPDGSGSINLTGRIKITGQSLPSVSDILQVDYTWIFSYDQYFDFDNKLSNRNPRIVGDSIDWGFSNAVRRERTILVSAASVLTATVTHPVSSVVSVNVFAEENTNITFVSSRTAIVVLASVFNVVSIIRNSDNAELWKTVASDGSFSGTTIYLPSDSVAVYNDAVTVVYNSIDVFNATTQGSFSGNIISVVPSLSAVAGSIIECNYIANVSVILPSTLMSSLPAIRYYNSFSTNTISGIGCQPTTHVYSGSSILSNLRQAPSSLALTLSGSVSPGILTVSGTTLGRADNYVFTATSSGLKQNISAAIKSYLGLGSAATIPSSVKLARISKVEKVTTGLNNVVLSTDYTYEILGYAIKDNSFVKDESIQDTTLGVTEVKLPATANNNSNFPVVGDKIRVTFYISKISDSEDVSFSKSGTLYTQKIFALVDTIAKSSGFTSGSSASATLTVTNMNQPANKVRYRSYYDYLAPKVNERITVRYNYDQLIIDSTLNVEDVRPIGADVLVKAAVAILVDITLYIVVTEAQKNNTSTIKQNVQDTVTSALNSQTLGVIVDGSDLENAAYTVSGVDRVRVTYFNRTGETGSVLSIIAQKNEYTEANLVQVFTETR